MTSRGVNSEGNRLVRVDDSNLLPGDNGCGGADSCYLATVSCARDGISDG